MATTTPRGTSNPNLTTRTRNKAMRYISTAPNPTDVVVVSNHHPAKHVEEQGCERAVAHESLHVQGANVSRMPIVKLPVDAISDTVAARLASSLLAMVLFLKNQIPLPIAQLARMSGKNSSTKAAKHRVELLNAFDTLSSHLTTTFSVLSTALARSITCEDQSNPQTINGKKDEVAPSKRRAYLAILLGPSLGTAKAKVFMGVDQFEVRVWGLPEDVVRVEDDEASEEEEKEESGGEEGSSGGGELNGSSDEEVLSESESETGSEDEDADSSDDEVSHQPPQLSSELESTVKAQSPSPPEPHRGPRIVAPPPVSYAEEQKFLQNAERLLSRALAAADADGHGLASEMSPTQTHLLIRAPRSFSHPAWVPRQNMTQSLDTSLDSFFKESGLESKTDFPVSIAKSSKKNKAEGVWLTGKDGVVATVSQSTGISEDDDMIWWSWDGKLAGFSDW